MNKKMFLMPFAAALAALSQSADATVLDRAASFTPLTPQSRSADAAQIGQDPAAGHEFLVKKDGDLFKFVIIKNEQGQLVTDHYSHTSHSSHASHRSHYSGS